MEFWLYDHSTNIRQTIHANGDALIIGREDAVMTLGCDVTFGASGSPLFATIRGERRLIAVVSGMSRSNGEAIAWAVRVEAAMAEVLAALD